MQMINYHSKTQDIILYTPEDFQHMQKACDLVSAIADEITKYVVAGTNTEYLDNLVHKWTIQNCAKPACIGYKPSHSDIPPYPKTICTSINNVVCHGIPKASAILKNGDIINIDITVIVDGWYGDTSRMYYVGKVPKFAQDLCERTYESMMLGIATVKPGSTIGCIGHAIQQYVESFGYSVVEGYCGHGVGQEFHRAPSINHHGKPNTGLVLEEGMIFTIEPMINLGTKQTKVLSDQWTVITKDSKPSAQFEHTVGVTKDGCHIFTKSKIGFDKPIYDLSKLNRVTEYDFCI